MPPEPGNLRFLRRLVTTLTVVMIGAVITVVALLVIRLGSVGAAPQFPDQLSAPEGEQVTAATLGQGFALIVTRDDAGVQRVHILDPDGAIRQSVTVE